MRFAGWAAAALRGLSAFYRWLTSSPSAGGALLLVFAALAIFLVNSPLDEGYRGLLSFEFGPVLGPIDLYKSVEHWISDGLMVLFFLVVGLDIKRELLQGQLSSPSKAALPAVAALGGMMVPALIFATLNFGGSTIRGWAIPSATDIAFSLAVLRVVGRWLPDSLRVFLTALAILDDLGAIVIIAIFYSQGLAIMPLLVALAALIIMLLLGRLGVASIWPYAIGGVVVWIAILTSGIHPTIAGVLVAMTIPLNAVDAGGRRLYDRIGQGIGPWVTLVILPLFALANAGISFAGISWSLASDPVTLGIALGLFLGKQIGVFLVCWLSVRIGLCSMPSGARWSELYGVAILTGIGFTMSLFTAALAFSDPAMGPLCRCGVIAGSLASALYGALYLWWLRHRRRGELATDAGIDGGNA